MNKQRAKQWASTHLPILESEFASVGFGGGKKGPSADDVQSKGLAKAMASSVDVPEELMRQKAKNEYFTYATGRQNVAYLHIQISLYKRYNPISWFGETALSFFFDSFAAPAERVEATTYTFDGKEKSLVQASSGGKDSSYDGFVWAVVHKDKMKELRDDRYDLSLTATRDNAKLPDWATVMSESAEVTEAMLTPELIKALNDAGEDLEALIVTDQPIDAPKKYMLSFLPSPVIHPLTFPQTQRYRPPQTRQPQHETQPSPTVHQLVPILPPPPRHSRLRRSPAPRSHAENQGYA